jgi:hypothetical protein
VYEERKQTTPNGELVYVEKVRYIMEVEDEYK